MILAKINSCRVASSSQTWSSKFSPSILLLDLSFFFQHNSVLFEEGLNGVVAFTVIG